MTEQSENTAVGRVRGFARRNSRFVMAWAVIALIGLASDLAVGAVPVTLGGKAQWLFALVAIAGLYALVLTLLARVVIRVVNRLRGTSAE